MNEDTRLSYSEVRKLLNVSERALRRMVNEDKVLERVRIGRSVGIMRSEVERYLLDRRDRARLSLEVLGKAHGLDIGKREHRALHRFGVTSVEDLAKFDVDRTKNQANVGTRTRHNLHTAVEAARKEMNL